MNNEPTLKITLHHQQEQKQYEAVLKEKKRK